LKASWSSKVLNFQIQKLKAKRSQRWPRWPLEPRKAVMAKKATKISLPKDRAVEASMSTHMSKSIWIPGKLKKLIKTIMTTKITIIAALANVRTKMIHLEK
jgi:hypothetical protein